MGTTAGRQLYPSPLRPSTDIPNPAIRGLLSVGFRRIGCERIGSQPDVPAADADMGTGGSGLSAVFRCHVATVDSTAFNSFRPRCKCS